MARSGFDQVPWPAQGFTESPPREDTTPMSIQSMIGFSLCMFVSAALCLGLGFALSMAMIHVTLRLIY